MSEETIYFQAKIKEALFWNERSVKMSDENIRFLKTIQLPNDTPSSYPIYEINKLTYYHRFDEYYHCNLFEFLDDGQIKRSKVRFFNASRVK